MKEKSKLFLEQKRYVLRIAPSLGRGVWGDPREGKIWEQKPKYCNPRGDSLH